MKYNRHVVFVTPGFASDEADSQCTPYLQDFFRALQAAQPDARISVIALQYPYRNSHYRWHGIDVYSMGGRNRRWKKLWVWRQCKRQIAKLHSEQPIDVLHAFWLGESAQCALQAGTRLGIPVVATLMGQDVLPENRYLRKLELGSLRLVALSAFSDGLFEQSIGRKADAIISFGIASGDVDRRASPDRPYDLLAVGSLIAVKRLDRFVRIVSQLRYQFPSLRALLVGEGPERHKIAAMIAELGLQSHLQMIPQLPRGEILELMSKAKVLVHTSKVEGMGLVLAEALARGCYLVSAPVGVADPGDKCLLADNTYQLGECAAHFLRHPVDWEPRVSYPLESCIAQHLELYGWQ